MIHISSGVRYDKVERHAELDVVSAYSISVPDGWIHRERFLDLSELIYVTEGQLHLAVNGEDVTLSAGDAYLIRRYSALSGRKASTGPCGFYTVDFRCTLEKYDGLHGRVLRISSRSSYAETLFHNLSFFGGQEQGDDYLRDASLALLLDLLYVSRNREQFGVPLKQYIIEKKLSAAKRLLAASDISVKQVGRAVGFAEPVPFEKFFKYHVKMTPKRYRNLYR